GGDRAERAVVGPVVFVVGRGLQVLADVDAQRRLAVAADVVGDADARRDVVVAGDTGRFREADWLRVEARRQRGAVVFGRRPAPGAVVSDRRLQRQPSARPLILR